MTTKELNTRTRWLYKKWTSRRSVNTNLWDTADWREYNIEQMKIKTEFAILYKADQECVHISFKSFRMMIRMNQALRVIPLHQFYLNIQI